jgi:hypothetical protein
MTTFEAVRKAAWAGLGMDIVQMNGTRGTVVIAWRTVSAFDTCKSIAVGGAGGEV